MRYLYIFPENIARPSGGTVHVLGLARALSHQGHQVCVLAPAYSHNIAIPDSGMIRTIRVPGRNLIGFLWFQVIAAIITGWRCLFGQADVVLVRSVPGWIAAICAVARLFRKRVVLEVNGIWWMEMAAYGYPTWVCRVAKFVFITQCWFANEILGVTEAIAEEAGRVSRFDPTHVHSVRNGSDPAMFDTSLREAARSELGLAPDSFAVALVTSFTPWHGILELIEAASLVQDPEKRRMRLILIGDGMLWDAARKRVEKLGLGGRVVLMGPLGRADICRLLVGMDLGVFFCGESAKMRFPGSPLKFFEYLAAGLPVLVTDDSHLRPLIKEFSLGRMIPHCVPEEIANALIEAMRDPLGRENGIRNRALAEKCFSWDWVALRVAKIAAGQCEENAGG